MLRSLARRAANRAREFHSRGSLADDSPKKIVAVLYAAGTELAARQPRLLGCKEHALGLRPWLESCGHTLVATDDKDGPECELERHLPDADVIITTPYHPAYLTRERLARAPKLKLALTAGIGSDHVDIEAAREAGIAVAEVSGSNVVSVAEHVVMVILALVRNYLPAHQQAVAGEWDVARIAADAYDLEGKTVGTVGAGRIGLRVLKRLAGFGCRQLLYNDYTWLPEEREAELGVQYARLDDLVARCDVITINCPLHAGTKGMFDAPRIATMRPGSFLVNTSRAQICDTQAVADAVNRGHLAGYAGDVWYPEPAPKDHPWRSMPRNAMTPHYSGSTLDAQARYATGVHQILERSFRGWPLNRNDVILQDGVLNPTYDRSAMAEERTVLFNTGWRSEV